MAEQERYEDAKKRVEELKGFYTHLFIYLAVNLFLFILNMLTAPDALWFYWPLIGWGIGILIHGLSVFVLAGMFGKDWEEKKIKDIMSKDKDKDESHRNSQRH